MPRRLDQLARTIESEIVPRLLLSHSDASRSDRVPNAPMIGKYAPPGAEEVAELARLTLHHEVCMLRSFVDALRQRGVPMDAVFMDLVGPAARLLGEQWERDEVSFTDVTIGLSRLHLLTRELGRQFVQDFDLTCGAHQVLLAPGPGEQHTLGLYILEAYFRRAGWDVWVSPTSKMGELVRFVRNDFVEMFGLSIGTETGLDPAADLIQAVKEASANPRLVVMVGGAAINERPDKAEAIGATAWARSAEDATSFMRRHIESEDASEL